MPVSKTALIAGVGPGLGSSLARKFAKEGCNVGLLARSSEFTESLAVELNQSGRDAIALSADIADPAQLARAVDQIRSKLGAIDLLVNHASAGGPFNRGLLETAPEDFERAWRVSAYGALLCCRQVVPDMLRHGGGAILFTGATSSVRGAALAFSSAKFAVRGMAQALAQELWPKGIHVAHVVIDGIIGEAQGGNGSASAAEEPLLDPDAIADTYWSLVMQDRSAWSFEVDVRPYRETFFE